MKRDRGDSLDSLNALKLKQLLDPENDNTSFISASKVSRNMSNPQKEDRIEKMTSSLSDKSRSVVPKSERGPGTVITRASRLTTRAQQKNKSILKDMMNPPAWQIDTSFERFLMRWNRGLAEKMFRDEQPDDMTIFDLYRIYKDRSKK